MKSLITVLLLFFSIALFSQAASKVNNAQNVFSSGQPRVIVSCDTLPGGTIRLYPKDQVTWKFQQLTLLPNTMAGYGILDGVPSSRKINNYPLTTDITIGKTDVGLPNVDNTSDINKPVSNPTQTALNLKVDKVSGKQLSTEDFTTAEKSKLAAIKEDYTNTVAVSSAGNAIFYITNDKTSTGTALFSNVTFVGPLVNDSTVNYTYGWTAYNPTTKSITINVKATPALNVSVLSLTLLGVPANVSNGTPVQVLIKGN